MPSSVRENDNMIRQFCTDNNIRTVLDVGTGMGTYSDILRPQLEWIDGVEVWEPYIEQFGLNNKYDRLFVGDAREVVSSARLSHEEGLLGSKYDLIIFGDVMEHMTEDEALTMWDHASKIAIWGMISIPIIHYPQGPEFGNPYEVHVQEHMRPDGVIDNYGPFEHVQLYPITGTFIRRF